MTNPSLDEREFAITLPRMGFEISGIEYDASRKLTKVQKFKSVQSGSTNVMNYNYMPVPYNISYNLYCFTATVEGETNYRTNFTVFSTRLYSNY